MDNENTAITVKTDIPYLPHLLVPKHCGKLQGILLHFYKNPEQIMKPLLF